MSSEIRETLRLAIKLLREGSARLEAEPEFLPPGTTLQKDLSGTYLLVVRDRVELAAEAVRLGLAVEAAARLLEWREFERFVSRAFESHGYMVKHDYRFKAKGLRRQVDVLAVLGKRAFCVDCKHWSKTGGLKQVVRRQLERCALLSETMPDRQVYPLVVTLGSNALIDGVPVVAAYALRDFLLNLDQYLDQLRVAR